MTHQDDDPRRPSGMTESVEEVSELIRKVREEIERSADILRPAELAVSVEAVIELHAKQSRRSIANTAEGVRVKPLEWIEYPNTYSPDVFGHFWDAETPFVRYTIEEVSGPDFDPDTTHYEVNRARDCLIHTTSVLDEAKAAAQADYEHRVLSALTSPQAGAVEPVGWVTADILAAMKRGERAVPGWKQSADFCIPIYAGTPAPQHNDVRVTDEMVERLTDELASWLGKRPDYEVAHDALFAALTEPRK